MYFRLQRNALASALIALAFCSIALFLWPQTAVGQDSAQGGGTNSPPVTLPRHAPGHLSRVSDLDVRIAAGQAPDPLSGSPTIISWDKLSLVFHDSSNQFMRKTYDVDPNLNVPAVKSRSGMQSVNGAGNMGIAAGYLGGTAGWLDIAAAWEYPAGRISVYVSSYDGNLGISTNATLNTSDQVLGGMISGSPAYGALIRVDTGDFDGDGFDEFVVAWEGANKSLNVRTYDTNGGVSQITPKGIITDESLGNYKYLSVVAGDFNADAKDEIAVAWQGSDGKLAIKVYSVTGDGTLVAEVKVIEALSPGQITMAAGDFNGDAIDEFAVAFNTTGNANLHVYQVTNNLHTLTLKGTAAPKAGRPLSTIQELVQRVLGLRAGDFNVDGIDELVMVYGAPTKFYCNVGVYAADSALTLTPKVTILSSWLSAYGDLSLTVGDLNRDSVAEVAAVTVFGAELGSSDIDLGMFQVTPDLGTISEKGHFEESDSVGYIGSNNFGHVALAAGAFDGKSVRVGVPVYKHMAQTKQIVAVINAPPKHEDEVNGQHIDVNITDRCTIPPCTYAKYETETKSTTTMQVTTNRDWSVSEEADLKFPHVKSSMKASYGESFEKTTTSFKSTEFGQDVEADADDVLVRLEQDLDMWEYPVYADGSDAIQGYILVSWPVKVDPACSSNCPAAITARIDGMNPTSYYLPNHEFGNVLSYSPLPPNDISTTIKSDVMTYMGPNAYQMWAKWSDVEDSETKSTSKLDLDASLTLSGWGQKLTTSGTYAQGETSVNKVSFEQSTEIHLYFFGIEQKYSFGVRPFMYWAKPDGHLVLDYAVQPLTSSPPSWWQTTYTMTDPAFNLPWKNGSLGDAYVHLSKEVTFAPQTAEPGAIVEVTAKVRNYSLIGAANVLVRFYLGDPEHGGVAIPGSDKVIANLQPLSAASVTIPFNTTGHVAGETLDIYAVIDPLRTLAEVHEENNIAYAQLPIVGSLVGDPPNSHTLFLTADDIAFDPPQPHAGQTVRISATVHALSGMFARVGVEFWDGRPAKGGKLIGGRLLPIVAVNTPVVAAVDWPTTNSFGRHEIWVTVAKHDSDQVSTDNFAYQTIELEAFPVNLFMPAIRNQQ